MYKRFLSAQDESSDKVVDEMKRQVAELERPYSVDALSAKLDGLETNLALMPGVSEAVRTKHEEGKKTASRS